MSEFEKLVQELSEKIRKELVAERMGKKSPFLDKVRKTYDGLTLSKLSFEEQVKIIDGV